MTKIEIRKFQKCDICKKEFEIKDDKILSEISLPIMKKIHRGELSKWIQNLDVCDDCIEKIRYIICKNIDIGTDYSDWENSFEFKEEMDTSKLYALENEIQNRS